MNAKYDQLKQPLQLFSYFRFFLSLCFRFSLSVVGVPFTHSLRGNTPASRFFVNPSSVWPRLCLRLVRGGPLVRRHAGGVGRGGQQLFSRCQLHSPVSPVLPPLSVSTCRGRKVQIKVYIDFVTKYRQSFWGKCIVLMISYTIRQERWRTLGETLCFAVG